MMITLFGIGAVLWVNRIRTVSEFLALVCLEGIVWVLVRNLY